METGDTLEFQYTVQSQDLAKTLAIDPDDHFPEVLATSRMVAFMELAAARLMKPILKDGELSVGVNVNINHLAATPNGTQITAIATYTGMEGKLHAFSVELHDQGGLAGSGTHTRAIISTERLLKGAEARNQ